MNGSPMKITLAVDGSEHSWAAVKLLQDLPVCRSPGQTPDKPASIITVVTVLIPRNASDYASRMDLLEKTQAALKEKNACVESELLVGYPAEKLVEYIEMHKPALIVLGAKGLRATLGILLGGVAQQLVEYASCPLLIVRPPYVGLRRILSVVDGSQSSINAVEFLGNFPMPSGTKITVAHVLPPVYLPGYPIPLYNPSTEAFLPPPQLIEMGMTARQEEEEELEGKELLGKMKHLLESCGKQCGTVLLRGDAASEIIDYARLHEVDLIVSGSRGLSQMRGWLLGSVSRKLVHYAHCSTLVVKTPE
ncbi:MAG: universal stress protein [Methanomicrobiales archaeon]|nr:universal stress protein [Methanomicrobiales archaeon]